MSKTKKPIMVEQAYMLIRRPLISEKSTAMNEKGQVVFLVAPEATKPRIKQAVESLFDVKVKSVNVIVRKGKRKKFRGIWGRRANHKKAIVTLGKDQNIELLTGVKS